MKMRTLFTPISKRALWIAIFSFCAVVSQAALLQAQTGATVDVGLITIPDGTTGLVKVSIAGSSAGLSDFQGRLNYDATIVNVREVTGLNGYTIAAFQIDNFDGEVRFIGFKSSGTLITEGEFVQFTVAAVGSTGDTTALDLEFITLNSDDGSRITHTVRPGRLTVGARQEVNVNFTWTPPNPEAGQEIQFTDSTSGGSGSFSRWSWDFGDGQTSTLQNPKHTFAQKGTYDITLTVEDNQGNTNNSQKQVVVRGQGEAITIPAHNYPNPAKTETTFSYQLPQGVTQATIEIYAFTGPLVYSQNLSANSNELRWNLQDLSGNDLPNGAYYYRIWASTPEGAVLSNIGKLVIIR